MYSGLSYTALLLFLFCFLFRPFSLELGKGIDDDGNDEMNQDSTSMQKIIIILFKSVDNRAGGSCRIYDFSTAMTVNSTYVLLLKVKQTADVKSNFVRIFCPFNCLESAFGGNATSFLPHRVLASVRAPRPSPPGCWETIYLSNNCQHATSTLYRSLGVDRLRDDWP